MDDPTPGTSTQRLAERAAAHALDKIADDLLGRAIHLTPMEFGDLRESGHTEPEQGVDNHPAGPATMEKRVVFDEVYAAAQHEGAPEGNPNWAHLAELTYTTPGTGSKFLERPLTELAPRYEAAMAAAVKAAVEGR